jgi:monoterpene epsilon-lactone hydrolase
MPNQALEAIIQMLKSRPLHDTGDVEQARAVMNGIPNFFPTPPDVERQPADVAGIRGEWVSAPGADPGRTILYLHGGGYTIGSIESHREMVSRIARASQARALLVDYRLAPENPFPAAVQDATAAYRWLLAEGVDPARTVIAGDSAGGGLTAATLVALRDAGDPLPAAGVCVSPWTDMEASGESMTTNADKDHMISRELSLQGAASYVGEADRRDPLASPIHADLTGLPPLLIQVGGDEVLLDDSTRLAAKAEADGVDVTLEVWPEMPHVWHFFAIMLPEGRQAIDAIGEFVRARTPATTEARSAAR